jgi:galactokinase
MDLGADKAAMIIKEENEVVMVEVKAVTTIKVNKVEDEVDGKTAMTEVEDEATTTEVEVRVAEAEMAVNRLVYKQNVIL